MTEDQINRLRSESTLTWKRCLVIQADLLALLDAYEQSQSRLQDIVKALDTVRSDLGTRYPALSEAYMNARAIAYTAAQPEENNK